MKRFVGLSLVVVMIGVFIAGCTNTGVEEDNGKYNVVTTTTILADIVREIAGDLVDVQALMGPGIDPHQYQASAGDVTKMSDADMVVFNGLHLEGKMGDVFENLQDENMIIFAAADSVDESKLLDNEDTPGYYDPHLWFDVTLWQEVTVRVADELKELDEENAATYDENLEKYLNELDELDEYIRNRVEELDQGQRVPSYQGVNSRGFF